MNFQTLIQKLIEYFKGVKTETRRINWLTKEQTIEYTVIVIVITLIVAAYLGGLDFIFTRIISRIIMPH